jgi:hypothetical protein
LEKLISSGKLSNSQVVEYLDYTRKVGDLLQLFTPGSVFLLDHNHMLEVSEEEDKKWSDIDSTLQLAHLKRKDVHLPDALSSKNVANNASSVPARRHSCRGICFNYNSPEGCPYSKERCRYEHIETHDRSARGNGVTERAPRFQKSFQSKDS